MTPSRRTRFPADWHTAAVFLWPPYPERDSGSPGFFHLLYPFGLTSIICQAAACFFLFWALSATVSVVRQTAAYTWFSHKSSPPIWPPWTLGSWGQSPGMSPPPSPLYTGLLEPLVPGSHVSAGINPWTTGAIIPNRMALLNTGTDSAQALVRFDQGSLLVHKPRLDKTKALLLCEDALVWWPRPCEAAACSPAADRTTKAQIFHSSDA